ncbi:MAG: 23S rRNA (adenine(2503)-C(2))-methyltransferase RlmN [Opitutales bacterium]
MKFIPDKTPIYSETFDSLEDKLTNIGEKPFRAGQILEWLYRKKATSWDEMSNLPKALRTWLAENYDIAPARSLLSKQAGDTTEKLLLELRDGSKIETVIIRVPQDGVIKENSRKTICISTQVGCAYGCKFCASGLDGWKRDLSTGEIVFQLMQVCFLERENAPGAPVEAACFDNIVVMGMGEPLANYDNLLAALQIVNAQWALNFGARRITVSTSGLVPQIIRLAEEELQFRLAISLHGATNEVRQQIMPINRKYPLEELIPAARLFSRRHGRMLTLEYILIEEINDTLDQAEELAKIAQDLHAHVNLIPYNTVEGLPWKRPGLLRQNTFLSLLRGKGASVTIRREKGHDINAACGQLRLQSEKKTATA